MHGNKLKHMKRTVLAGILLVCAVLSSHAQTFTEHLEQQSSGQGTVTLTQDMRLTEIVNGADFEIAEDAAPKNDFSMHVGKRQRMKGYRIQVYWGSSQRVEQQKAQRVGAQVTAAFPELRSYVTFSAPYWRCMVGDFATREAANEYLGRVKRIARDAVVVRSEIIQFK
jgi:hypothetical protein